MPYLKLDTNLKLDAKTTQDLLGKCSSRISSVLGKSENYIMIHINSDQSMMFAGSPEPLAYLELKSIGLQYNQAQALSALLCEFIAEELNIHANRIYIEFTDIPREMWGWDGRTFG